MPRLGLWPLRVLWATLPITAGPAFADALASRDRPAQVVLSIGLWALWAAVLGATLVPRSVTLTALRVVAPAAVLAAAWAALSGASAAAGAVAIVATTAAAGAALAPSVADALVDGSSYGDERRFTLRVPATLLFGPVQITWLITVIGLVAGPILLAAQLWIAGAVAVVLGWPLAALFVRRIHVLARRWLVYVPAGVVLHDPLGIEAVLFPRSMIRSLGPAPADTDGLDVSIGAPGLALQLDLTEPIDVPIPDGRRKPGVIDITTTPTDCVVFVPARPAAVLDEAARRDVVVAR